MQLLISKKIGKLQIGTCFSLTVAETSHIFTVMHNNKDKYGGACAYLIYTQAYEEIGKLQLHGNMMTRRTNKHKSVRM